MQTQGRNKTKPSISEELPPVPKKRYFTIGETSRLCDVKPHVLRYWEQEFPQLKPNKRRGNRRYYQHKDVSLIRQIRELLYEQGYTITGARNFLSTQKPKVEEFPTEETATEGSQAHAVVLHDAIQELEDIIDLLKNK